MGNLTPTIVIALIALFIALPGCINNGLALKDRWQPGKPMVEPAAPPRSTSWSMFIFNIIGAGLLFWLAYQAWPSQGQRQPESLSQQLPPPKSKQALNELFAESGQLLELIEKTGIPQAEEWRAGIGSLNPEKICTNLDRKEFLEKISALTNKMTDAHVDLVKVIEQNSLDAAELTKVFPQNIIDGFARADAGLKTYASNIRTVAPQASCEMMIALSNMPYSFAQMYDSMNSFSVWVAATRDNLTKYHEDLHKELRKTP